MSERSGHHAHSVRRRVAMSKQQGRSRMPVHGVAAGPAPYSNPYLAGIGLGLVLLAAFVLIGRGLGASGALQRAWSPACLQRRRARRTRSGREWLSGYLADGDEPAQGMAGLRGARRLRWARCSRACSPARRRSSSRRGRACRAARPPALAFAGGALMAIGAALAPRLHERPGAHRRLAAQSRQLGVHDDGLRRRVRGGVVREVAVAMMAPFFKYGAVRRRDQPGRRLRHRHRLRLLPRARRLRQRAQAGVAVLPERPGGLQGDVHGHRHGDARRDLPVVDRRPRPVAGLPGADLPAAADRRRPGPRRRLRRRRLLPGHGARRDGDRPRRRRSSTAWASSRARSCSPSCTRW